MNKFKVGDWVTRNDYPYGPNLDKFWVPLQITSICKDNHYLRFWGHKDGWGYRGFKLVAPANFRINPDDYL